MFDSLSDRLESAFKKFKGQGRLDESNIQEGLREVRLALLEADVNFKVVKDFTERIRERCLGQEVLGSLTPGQQVIKIVNEEMVGLLGGETQDVDLRGKPAVVMMVGLQGSGKTTSAAKLALHFRRLRKMKPYLVPADVYRPAAIDQLQTLGRQLDVPVFASDTSMDPVEICRKGIEAAREEGCNVVLLDTAGRLHIDETLMDELANIKAACAPGEILFVADAMIGQEAVTVAEAFNEKLDISGVVLTKMDGDARGGAALSIKSVTGKPIKFVGMGEKVNDLEVFHPDRAASRILGMGDILTLIEKAQTTMDQEEAEAIGKKFQRAEFDFEDFRTQMRRLKKLGSLEGILKLLPGMKGLKEKLGNLSVPDKEMGRIDAIISSMTMEERRNPAIINASRKERIARGSGVSVNDVNQLVKNFEQMRKMMKRMMGGGTKGKTPRMPRMPKGMPGMPGMPKGLPGMGGMPGGMPGMSGMPGMGDMGDAEGGRASAGSTKAKTERKKRKKTAGKNKKKKK
ncbi:signal recognition particle subunit SRP54 [Desulfobaculum xiamenense]|uniref:Signal recognition particle protein n=1 Tax=Desulfobaculum xiamenense TaxID=995050 RepID=A0A846QK64_9BACT|nr:signal recognition particle protein [Desulfobaculum xiamenense]NJB68598.1 signal recognition particle subunit SRP54 [Desulfobaculum xiamenense]